MKLNVVNLNKVIEVNNCPRVTNPMMFEMGNLPTVDGLFSYELFGQPNSYDRKTIWGYIDLKAKFLHPMFYRMLVKLDKRIAGIVNGSKFYVITATGELKEDDNKGQTGLDFLYKNFRKIKFRESESMQREIKLDLLTKTHIDEIFVDKFLVLPAALRDINLSKSQKGKVSYDEINNHYVKLINLASSIDTDPDVTSASGNLVNFDFMGEITKSRIQLTLVDIYTEMTKSLAKKTGHIQSKLIGRTVDYATRSVISAARIKSNTYKEQRIPFNFTGVPLSQLCTLFFPFFIHYIQKYLERLFGLGGQFHTIYYPENMKKEPTKVRYVNPMDDYTPNEIKKLIELYIKSPTDRFHILTVNTEAGKLPTQLHIQDLKRDFTLTDLLYIVAKDIVVDKHVYVTRYPVETFQNIYPSKIVTLSTYKTKTQQIENKLFPDYPEIYLDYPCTEDLFIDTVWLNNSYLDALGGDFDGKCCV